MNRYPLWKYILIAVIIAVGAVYSLPNIYGKDPALQISPTGTLEFTDMTKLRVDNALNKAAIPVLSSDMAQNRMIVRFRNEEVQLKAQAVVQKELGNAYVVALNLAPATPDWLKVLGAEPMFLGLDLRGGVHFLMEVDMKAAVKKSEERYVSDLRTLLRENKIRYKTITMLDRGGVLVRFRDAAQRDSGISLIEDNYKDLMLTPGVSEEGEFPVTATLKQSAIIDTQKFALQHRLGGLRTLGDLYRHRPGLRHA